MTAYLDRVAQGDLGGASKQIWGPKYVYFVTTEQILEIQEIQFFGRTVSYRLQIGALCIFSLGRLEQDED